MVFGNVLKLRELTTFEARPAKRELEAAALAAVDLQAMSRAELQAWIEADAEKHPEQWAVLKAMSRAELQAYLDGITGVAGVFIFQPYTVAAALREDWVPTCAFHFSAFTPFTISQRQRDASPTKAGIRMVGNI